MVSRKRSLWFVPSLVLCLALPIGCGSGDESGGESPGNPSGQGGNSKGGGGQGGGSSGQGGAKAGAGGGSSGTSGQPGAGTAGLAGDGGAGGSAGDGGAAGDGGNAGDGGAAGDGGGGDAGGNVGGSGQGGVGGMSGSSGQAGDSGAGGAQGGAGQGGDGGQGGVGGSCDGVTVLCGGVCVNTASDPQNCGVCGKACLASESCEAGVCAPIDPCVPDPCNGHGTCAQGACTCDAKFTGALCDACAEGFSNFPDCTCLSDNDCGADPKRPYCDPASGACVACVDDGSKPPEGLCQGVCSLVAPKCVEHGWQCSGPGYEPVEESCDGFDNDCDGSIDENCPPCVVPIDKIKQNLGSIWDLDFDFACNSYLTSLVSGPDFTRVVSYDTTKAVTTYFGNANQNMGFGLVDPDPNKRRVVVSYSCGNSSCLAKNGLTLLYTCSAADPGCGCVGQANCPGFLNVPFLPTVAPTKTALTFNGFEVGVPTGLAVATGSRYFAGNYRPLTCDSSPSCVPCDQDHLGMFCKDGESCCDSSPFGRLAEFTLPEPGKPPMFRIARVIEGEQIFGLSGGRDGSVWVGTYVSATKGNLYRYDPFDNILTLIATYNGAIFSITQERRSGDWFIETRTTPKIVRLSEFGLPLPLPPGVPSDPPQQGVLQAGPDGKLYRLIGKVDSAATLDVYELQ